jgi:hypothetical protein
MNSFSSIGKPPVQLSRSLQEKLLRKHDQVDVSAGHLSAAARIKLSSNAQVAKKGLLSKALLVAYFMHLFVRMAGIIPCSSLQRDKPCHRGKKIRR